MMRMTVGRYVLAVLLIAMAGLAVVGAASVYSARRFATASSQMEAHTLGNLVSVGECVSDFDELSSRVARTPAEVNLSEVEKHHAAFATALGSFHKRLAALEQADANAGTSFEELNGAVGAMEKAGEKIFKAAADFKQDEATAALNTEFFPAQARCRAGMQTIVSGPVQRECGAITQGARRSVMVSVATAGGVMALVGVVGFWFHMEANLVEPGSNLFDKMVNGAPPMAPPGS